MAQPALCGRCGAPISSGASGCAFCGVAFVGGVGPGAGAATAGGADRDVVEQVKARNKIVAIKIYKERYKTSLAQAKAAVDAIEQQLGLG